MDISIRESGIRDVTIRRCAASDAPALELVGRASFLETYAGVLQAADILAFCETEHAAARYADWLARQDYRLWIAEAAAGRAPVGYAVVSPPDLPVPTGEGDLELKRIYTLHRLHGSGLGRRLLDAALEGARQAGARRLLLGVFGGNDRAKAFYARQGFTQAGVRRFQVGANAYDDLVLARTL
ncbi:GNAT family N-acetyltransferase [Phenylobacterium hankyongense]|uniref:GNAT family N-acetyltransferase n=1 Tax=Phenylobacterium hankyongense TaxID=1813876 RepID=A0A328B002_9CAUL|nr:GNAT family N-acetyltransferase [Phenylobacterium hankyongense]RAK60503.1 GNAT family N-acetyltransferase [Phenylobacterium hankyongense]